MSDAPQASSRPTGQQKMPRGPVVLTPGEAEILKAVWDRHARELYSFAVGLTKNEADGADLVSDVFRRISRDAAGLAGIVDLQAFLRVMARRIFVDTIRQRAAREQRHEQVGIIARNTAPAAPPLTDEALRAAISSAFRAIPADQRRVVEARLLRGESLEQIAKKENVPLQTVASRFRYALNKLRDQLRPYHDCIQKNVMKKNTPVTAERIIKPLEPKRVPSAAPGLEAVAALAVDDGYDPIDQTAPEYSPEISADIDGTHDGLEGDTPEPSFSSDGTQFIAIDDAEPSINQLSNDAVDLPINNLTIDGENLSTTQELGSVFYLADMPYSGTFDGVVGDEVVDVGDEVVDVGSEVVDPGDEVADNGSEIISIENPEQWIDNLYYVDIGVDPIVELGQGVEIGDPGQDIVDDGGEVVDPGQDIVDDGGEVVDPGQDIVDDGGEVVDPGQDIVDDGGEVVDPGQDIVDDGGEVVDPGQEGVDIGGDSIVEGDGVDDLPISFEDIFTTTGTESHDPRIAYSTAGGGVDPSVLRHLAGEDLEPVSLDTGHLDNTALTTSYDATASVTSQDVAAPTAAHGSSSSVDSADSILVQSVHPNLDWHSGNGFSGHMESDVPALIIVENTAQPESGHLPAFANFEDVAMPGEPSAFVTDVPISTHGESASDAIVHDSYLPVAGDSHVVDHTIASSHPISTDSVPAEPSTSTSGGASQELGHENLLSLGAAVLGIAAVQSPPPTTGKRKVSE